MGQVRRQSYQAQSTPVGKVEGDTLHSQDGFQGVGVVYHNPVTIVIHRPMWCMFEEVLHKRRNIRRFVDRCLRISWRATAVAAG